MVYKGLVKLTQRRVEIKKFGLNFFFFLFPKNALLVFFLFLLQFIATSLKFEFLKNQIIYFNGKT